MTVAAATRIAYRSLLNTRGESITYRRGAEELSVVAMPGQDEFPSESTEGLTTKERTRDFLIEASKLVLAAVAATPEPGDQIDWPGLGTFEVLSPGGSEPEWRYEGSHNFFVRVHTREI